MSILIKDMQMPENCEKCPFLDYEEGFCLASGVKGKSGWYESKLRLDSIKDGRHADCPLVHVPPHGRLIDADALMNDEWTLHKQVMRMGGYAIHEMPLDNPNVPIVIPADEKE